MNECVISALMSIRNLRENSFSIGKEMLLCLHFHRIVNICTEITNKQLNDLFKVSLFHYHIINAISECYTKWISYFSVWHFLILGWLKGFAQ